MTISHRLLLGVAVTALLIWVVGFYATTVSQKSLRKAIEQTSAARASAIMDEIDRVMHGRIADWIAYSHSRLVQRSLKQSNQQFSQLPDVQHVIDEHDRQWRQASPDAPTPFMNDLRSNDLAHDMRVRMDELEKANGFKVIGEVFITNRFGANVAQTNRTSDYRQDDEAWWQVAKDQSLYVGDIAYDESAGVYSTDICVRVVDEDDEFLGVLKSVLNIQEVLRIVDS